MKIAGCTGALIAGGRGTRMGGARKALLEVGGEPLLARSLGVLRGLFPQVLIVANERAPYEPFGAPVVPDAIAGKGAPGGLHAALGAASGDWVFAAACDMPFLDPARIRALLDLRAGAPAVLVRWKGRLEPLFAFWSKACLATLEAMLRAGEPSFADLAWAVGARVVSEEEWRRVDPMGRSFFNVNTPADLEAARKAVERA